ncbi:uncharacterized protein BXZ73DRAFT_60386 [Epithele typhae]|uniref:uncharacterized protein n=1 Tax=Epithele typhae TaxID=378194 RepID=UPI0020082ED9|nr:uncharacterized protein BXZ73DRAFT_60386 [Epithele typhae]KAH9907650.1 hypothetical protein BXZ73DRAFT_60386 [Epithele typhae]
MPDRRITLRPERTPGAPIDIPTFQNGAFSEDDFYSVWERNKLVVVRGIDRTLQGAWTPAFLMKRFGRERVKPIYCGTDIEAEGEYTLADFLSAFEGGDSCDALKLKDWPPQDLFRQKFPDYHDSFIEAIPVPTRDVAALNGVKNLAAHFDRSGCPPDLGPKMYVAYGNPHSSHGTTKLHLDFTDAVNLMTFCPDPSQVGAVWHASPPESQPHIRHHLRTMYPTEYERTDPIHSQESYITDQVWEDLRLQYGVQYVRIEQFVGDAIFIPAGWPHQEGSSRIHGLSILINAVKIACDFVSLHNLDVTAGMVPQQRAHRLNSGGHGEDLLQLDTLVWHAWRSLSTFPASAMLTEAQFIGGGM